MSDKGTGTNLDWSSLSLDTLRALEWEWAGPIWRTKVHQEFRPVHGLESSVHKLKKCYKLTGISMQFKSLPFAIHQNQNSCSSGWEPFKPLLSAPQEKPQGSESRVKPLNCSQIDMNWVGSQTSLQVRMGSQFSHQSPVHSHLYPLNFVSSKASVNIILFPSTYTSFFQQEEQQSCVE